MRIPQTITRFRRRARRRVKRSRNAPGGEIGLGGRCADARIHDDLFFSRGDGSVCKGRVPIKLFCRPNRRFHARLGSQTSKIAALLRWQLNRFSKRAPRRFCREAVASSVLSTCAFCEIEADCAGLLFRMFSSKCSSPIFFGCATTRRKPRNYKLNE
jgi:hypothetical protein